MLGYPEAALADAEQALKDAREIGQAATLMYALYFNRSFTHILCGNYAAATHALEELVALADEKGALFWKVAGMLDARLLSGLDRQSFGRSPNDRRRNDPLSDLTDQSCLLPSWLSYLARAHAELGQFDDAWRCIDEAMTPWKQPRKSGSRPKSTEHPAKLR